MHGHEYEKIKQAVTMFDRCDSLIEHCQRQKTALHSNKINALYVGFVGTNGYIDIPEGMQKELLAFLDSQFERLIGECRGLQNRVTAPAGTEVKTEPEFWPEDSGDCS